MAINKLLNNIYKYIKRLTVGGYMATKVKKVTPQIIKKMILEEAQKLQLETLEQGKKSSEDIKAKKVDADKFADSLECKVEHLKELVLKEEKLISQLKKIREAKFKLGKYLMDKV